MTRPGWAGAALLAALAAGCQPCDIKQVATDKLDPGATDCGTFAFPRKSPAGVNLPDGGFAPASGGESVIQCALQAQAANHAFQARFTTGGTDTNSVLVYVRTREGRSFKLSQSSGSSPFPHQGSVEQVTCDAFGEPQGTSDFGPSCRNPGVPSSTCF